MYIDTRGFYYWMQRELQQELNEIYTKIHRIEVCGDWFSIWFMNNEDVVSIPLSVMKNIYINGKSLEELVAVIDNEYIARIKK